MRSAQSYPLSPAAIRPERHRMRQQRPVRKRIRSSVSAGHAEATFRRCSRTNQVRTILDQKPQFCRPCSASADVSSINSSTDSAEQCDAGKNLACNTLQKIMHTKHQVIRRTREQMIKLVNNDLLPASQGDLPGGRASQTKINRSPMGYDLERRRSLCEQICQEDDTLECPRLIRDKGKYSFTARKPSETHADDGRSLNSKNHFREHKFEEERHSPDGTQYSLINRRFTRKSNKFFVPFTNNDIEEEPKPKNDKYADKLLPPQTDGKEEINDQLKGYNDLESQRLISSGSRPPPVKTFYENPYLKGPPGSMLPILTESTPDGAFLSRSTNTSPVLKQTQSTNTIEDSTMQPMSLAVGKDEARRRQSFHRLLHVIQPILFVLAMFTVSMSGAYVGVMVASAGCSGYSDMECEPSILQWLFSSRRHIRAF